MLQIVALFDQAVEAFGTPFFVPHIGSAVRSFTDEASNPESAIYKHPTDYSLYHIGTFDPASGALDSFEHKLRLARAQDFSTNLKLA
ncbi:MAG: nonstructural protein [Microvirus sp.]|nr:MAG: nonstructural protein [Microvirus sp.]